MSERTRKNGTSMNGKGRAARALRAQPSKVTQEVFDRLPALLTAFEVRCCTGLDDHELAAEVASGRIVAWKRGKPRKGCQGSYKKYTKASVAAVAGFTV